MQRKLVAYATLHSLLTLSVVISGLSIDISSAAALNKKACKLDCRNGDNCNKAECSSCQFHCGGTCSYKKGKQCALGCDQNTCGRKNCKRCIFCTNPGGTCKMNTFIDVTSNLFQKQDTYWYQSLHSGRPYNHWSSPVFVDLNDDGRLDYFNSMHVQENIVTNGSNKAMELGESVRNDFTKDGIHLIENESDFQRLRPVSDRIIINDPEKYTRSDSHGHNLADLDGDGILDILIASGGNEGRTNLGRMGYDFSYSNFLFWGEEGPDELTGKNVTFFRGGREDALKAGVAMSMGRGRINYLLDVNGDGLLDIFCLQSRSISNKLSPGILLINQGNRTWKKDPTMSEFTLSMILTDADSDGFAQEIMLIRSFCFPQRKGPKTDPIFPEYGKFPKRIKKFCKTRPVGSMAVYKFNPDKNQMDEISNKYTNIRANKKKQPPCCPHGAYGCRSAPISMVSADFDGDLLTDHVVLFMSKMVFYFSDDRAAYELLDETNIGAEIEFPVYCSSALSVRIIDLDNDGVEEILVMCKIQGTFLLYTRGLSKRDWVLDNSCNDYGSMGAINNITLTGSTEQDIAEICSRDTYDLESLRDVCEYYKKNGRPPVPKTNGLCLVDLNNDGFLDAVVTYDYGYLRFLKNVPSEKSSLNRFISFSVKGDGKSVNLYGIGAIVILYTETEGRETNQFREVSSYQHISDKYGCKDDRITFGLGQWAVPIRVIVRWPNGVQQTWSLNGWTFSGEIKTIQLALLSPTTHPTDSPTQSPTSSPTTSPTKSLPSTNPTLEPSSLPSIYPTLNPTQDPSNIPSDVPSYYPTLVPNQDSSNTQTLPCIDDPTFYVNKPKSTCSWIGRSEARITNQCIKTRVKSACPYTCGLCWNDNI